MLEKKILLQTKYIAVIYAKQIMRCISVKCGESEVLRCPVSLTSTEPVGVYVCFSKKCSQYFNFFYNYDC